MGAAVIPCLNKALEWKPSPLMLNLYQRFPRFPLAVRYVQGGSDPRAGAAFGLGEIGPDAHVAISNLQNLEAARDLGSSWYPNLAARAALIKIRGEPLSPYIEELRDTSDCLKWYPKAMMLGQFGTNGVAAVPVLLAALNPTNNDIIHGHALIALGQIRCRPDLCVPAITPFLRSPSVSSQQKAMHALLAFGPDAKPAVNEIIVSLSDPDPWTRHMAEITLKRVDPVAAHQAKVK